MCDVKYDMNFIIGTLLYLCPNGKVKTTQTGGTMMKTKNSNMIFHAGQVSDPRQSS